MSVMRWTSRRIARLEAQAAARRAPDDDTAQRQRFWRLVLSDYEALQLARACTAIIYGAADRDPEMRTALNGGREFLSYLDDASLHELRRRRVALDERLKWVEAHSTDPRLRGT